MPEPDTDLAPLWVPLLRRLNDATPTWGVWKNVDRALAGHGDVDTAAPERDWPACIDAFTSWMTSQGHGPVVVCTHPPKTLFLLALTPDRRSFAELDVLARKYFRGATMFRAEDMLPLYLDDARGFRRARDGAEGLIVLVQNGARWGGEPNREVLRSRPVADLLAKDPEGVEAAARAFGFPARAVRDLADAVIGGAWDRDAMRAIERSAMLRAPLEPAILARRIRFKLWSRQRCPVIDTIFHHDRAIDDPDAWLARVRRGHRVIGDA